MLLCSTFILYLDFIIKIFCDCDDFHATQISIILVISKGKMSILVLLYFITVMIIFMQYMKQIDT